MSEARFQEIRTAVIQDVIQLAREKYVYPEMGRKCAVHLQARLQAGAYDHISGAAELATQLTGDLQAVSSDLHWSVVYDPDGAVGQVDPEHEADAGRLARYLVAARKSNFGFRRVERLAGNIGYIDLRYLYPSEYGGETAVAAMNLVANCDALIIDLRQNSGGFPSMVQLITSYLLDPTPRHLNTFYYRPSDERQQFWSFPHVPGRRRPDMPLYLLTSGATGSGAEEFAYNLKQMGRATLIGETTLGAAHPVTRETVQHDFVVRLPYGRPINPITGSNWEGTGVEPDIPVAEEESLKTAHLEALAHLLGQCEDDGEREMLAWEAEIVESEYAPLKLSPAALARCAGVYGERSFSSGGGWLLYGHQAYAYSWRLVPLTETRFRLDRDVKFEFVLDQAGRASAVRIFYGDGRPELFAERTG